MTNNNMKTTMNWISKNITPRKTPCKGYSSYWMKHIFEKDTGMYITNDQFKEAMLRSGYTPIDEKAINWEFCVSKKSPMFMMR